jgi:poly-gamma-glutamate synthesis protein (capsule biosynthesis protein)
MRSLLEFTLAQAGAGMTNVKHHLILAIPITLTMSAFILLWPSAMPQANLAIGPWETWFGSKVPAPQLQPSGTKVLPQTESAGSWTLAAVGDIMLSREVERKMLTNGMHYPFSETRSLIQSADFAFANLETSITPGRQIQDGEFSFRADPRSADALAKAGFDLVSLANNHSPNFGETGLKDTFNYLDESGIVYSGAGSNAQEAHRPRFFFISNTRVAFLSYTDGRLVPPTYEAAESRAGTAYMNIESMAADVQAAKADADMIIVSMHYGTEYVY